VRRAQQAGNAEPVLLLGLLLVSDSHDNSAPVGQTIADLTTADQTMADYDWPLPKHQIAQTPIEPRDAARLLVACGDQGVNGQLDHRQVRDLPDLLDEGDLLVVNYTKVLPARLLLRKPTGGQAEVLLLETVDLATGTWSALVRPGKSLPPGTVLVADDATEVVEVGDRLDDGIRLVRILSDVENLGVMALPPYIHEKLVDPDRYQTVYARRVGSVAAPTAGLHLTDAVLQRCKERGVGLATVDLMVGLDTFRPMSTDDPSQHVMHTERYVVPAETMQACAEARRVVAVGTTAVRALESAALAGKLEGRTDLFIRPGFEFKVVDLMMTNFHLPRTTLLLMVAAFAGPNWRRVYDQAVVNDYRFLSFGDAMLLARAV